MGKRAILVEGMNGLLDYSNSLIYFTSSYSRFLYNMIGYYII